MKTFSILALAGMIACGATANAATTIDPQTLQLTVDGKPFFIRGMNYSPETRGWNSIPNSTSNQFTSKGPQGQDHSNGVWLCSPANEYAPGDYQSSCLDNDLTGLLTGTSPYGLNAKYNAALTEKWGRDLAKLQSIGVNTIRLYDVQGGSTNGQLPKNHKPFLDAALKKGIYVIFPVLTDFVKNNADKNNLLTISVTNLIKETCGNPAVIAYNVGNEFPMKDNKVANNVKKAIQIIEKQCPKALITYSVEDDPGAWAVRGGHSWLLDTLGNTAGATKPVTGIDFLLINEYRNESNGGLAAYPELFADMKKLAETYRVPVAIGETGEYDNQKFAPDWYNKEWQFILNNAKANYVLGSLYFNYSDEPIKKGNLAEQRYMGIVTASWPQLRKNPTTSKQEYPSMEDYVDFPDVVKDASYNGIPSFTDPVNRKIITYPNSNVGKGRFNMFDDITRCNYLTGLSPSSIATGPCSP